MAVIGLFLNRVPEGYERVNESEDDLPTYDRKISPETNASFISKLLFMWLNPLLLLGYKRPLEMSDLYDVQKGYHSKEVYDVFEDKWQDELMRPKYVHVENP